MTGNHLMLLLFRSVLSVCRGSRGRVQKSSLIGHSIDIWLYGLSLLIRWVRVCALTAYHKCTPCKRSCEFYHISVLLDPVVDIHQRRSVLRLCPFHESRYVYPSMIRLHLQLKVRPIGASYGACFIAAFRVCVKHIFSWKKNSSANWPCLNKALLSSLTELSNLCKCLCHS